MAPVLVRIHVANPPSLGKQFTYTTSSQRQRERERYTIGGPSAGHPPPLRDLRFTVCAPQVGVELGGRLALVTVEVECDLDARVAHVRRESLRVDPGGDH